VDVLSEAGAHGVTPDHDPFSYSGPWSSFAGAGFPRSACGPLLALSYGMHAPHRTSEDSRLHDAVAQTRDNSAVLVADCRLLQQKSRQLRAQNAQASRRLTSLWQHCHELAEATGPDDPPSAG
jgi:hypothetical protein